MKKRSESVKNPVELVVDLFIVFTVFVAMVLGFIFVIQTLNFAG